VLAIVAGGAGIYLYRKHAASTAAAAQATSTAATAVCQDANGNTVDCNSLLAVNSEGGQQYEQLTSQLTGLSGQDAALQAAVTNLQGQPSTGPAGPAGAPGPPGPPGGTSTTTTPPAAMAKIPVTFGQRASTAKAMIQAAGFTVSTNPAESKMLTYESIGSSPEGGKTAPKGSHVVLNVRPKTY
jgi:hypothetical protein